MPSASRELRPQITALLWGLCLAVGCQDSTVIVGKLPPPIPSKPRDASVADSATRNAVDGATVALPDSAIVEPVPDAATTNPRSDLSRFTLSVDARPHAEFCKGRGIAISSQRADAAPADCESRIEPRVFAYGLCACEELRTDPASFLIDSFDSGRGAYSAGQTGGNVGLSSASLQLADDTQILGSLWVAGEGALALAAPRFTLSGDLKTNATLHVNAQNQHIVRDLWTAGDIVVNAGSLRVGRDAYQAFDRSGLAAIDVAGERRIARDLHVPAPCSCQTDAPIDVQALVKQAAANNDNAALSFDASTLEIPGLITNEQILPCGRLHAPSLTVQSTSTYWLSSNTRTALFVSGDLTVGAYSTLSLNNGATLPPNGELDVFIAGDLNVEANSTLALGFPARPAATRVFVAGQINARGILVLAAELYAPNASFASATLADAEMYGAIYARKIQLPSKRFHYDRAILDSGEACRAPAPQACSSCSDCPDDLSCRQGTCQPCQLDADCCEPLTCSARKCQILVSNWP